MAGTVSECRITADVMHTWRGKKVSSKGGGQYAGPCPVGGAADHDGFGFWPTRGNFYCRYGCRHICGGQPHPSGGTVGWVVGWNGEVQPGRARIARPEIPLQAQREMHRLAMEYHHALSVPPEEYRDLARRAMEFLTGRGIRPEVALGARLGLKNSSGHWLSIPVGLGAGMCYGIKYRNLDPCDKGDRYRMEGGSSASTLYTNALFKPAKVVAVVEGVLDTLALQSAGIPAVAPASGAAGWNDSFPLLFRGKRVVVVADNDEPGLQYGTAVVGSLETAGIPTIMATVPTGKDVGEFAAQFSDWRERTQALRALWESWLGSF